MAESSRASPVVWVLLGMGVTLVAVVVLRVTSPDAAPTSPAAATSSLAADGRANPDPVVHSASAATSSARADFADLYLGYLLKTYYVYERGFCTKLLVAICEALLSTKLLNTAATCERLPNAELILAIGRYQHETGLPVDGKAGPDTVRGVLGGGFSSRRAMAEKYCPGWRPPEPARPQASTPKPDATVVW